MRHQTGDTAVAVQKRLHPEQTVVCGGKRENRIPFAKTDVDLRETSHGTPRGAWADDKVPTHLDIAPAHFARNDTKALRCLRLVDPNRSLGNRSQKPRWSSQVC